MTEYCIRCGAELGPLPYREVCDTCIGEIQRSEKSLKTFTITARVRILPPGITIQGLIDYSWLRHKKKWKNNRRYYKKFYKNFYKYIPHWVACEWANIPMYTKATNEIMEAEDNRILSELRNAELIIKGV